MQQLHKILIGLFTSTLILTGCQSFQPKQQTPQTQFKAQDQFSLQGKIGVRTPQQSGSAFFTWQQQQEHFDIEITGALGIGKTHIQGQLGKVTLESAKTGTITAQTPEELLKKATGWQTPITHLIKWVQAQPATPTAKVEYDIQHHPITIQEDQWAVTLSYNENATQPNKLILKQQLESNQENRITMVIQNR